MQAIWSYFMDPNNSVLVKVFAGLTAFASLVWLLVQIYAKVKELRDKREKKPCSRRKESLKQPQIEVLITNLPRRNPRFTGRDETLAAIENSFKENSALALTQTISGLGGVGKSQTVLEYAHRHSSSYKVVWWMNAESGLSGDCLELLHRFNILVDKEDPTVQEIQAEMRAWYANHHDWLMIFDNAEDYRSLKSYLPATVKGHVLITTRDKIAFRSIAKQMDLDVFSEETALSFLQERTKFAPDNYAKALAEHLGYLPLALEQAAAYMTAFEPHKNYAEYLGLLRRSGLRIMETEEAMPIDYEQVVTKTWKTTEKKIGVEAKHLLHMCAFFAPDKIPMNIIIDAAEKLPHLLQDLHDAKGIESLRKMLMDEIGREEIIAKLTKFSFLKRDDKRGNPNPAPIQHGFFAMHRLVQQVIRNSAGDDTTYLIASLSIIVEALPKRFKDSGAFVHFISVANHAVAVLGFAKNAISTDANGKEELILVAEGFKTLSDGYWWCGKYDESREYAKQAAAFGERAYGLDHPKTADAYTNLALAYRKLDRLPESLELHNKALAIYMIAPDKWQAEIASTYNYLGTLHRLLHDYEISETNNKMALSIFINLEPRSSSVASTYCNLGDLFGEMQKLEEALEMYEKARVIYEEIFDKGHAYTARSYNSIGDAYHNIGNYEKALVMYEKALAIDEEFYGPSHPSTATTYSNLGKLYSDMRRKKQALEMYQKALTIRQLTLGDNHPYTQASFSRVESAIASIGRKGKKKAIAMG